MANAAASLPMAACHRDFHARNLLLGDERLVVVDFQDLMAGPLLYDAASLVWDNYCDLDRRTTATTLAAFWRQCRRQLAPSSAARVPVTPPGLPAAARQAFCFVGLQRSLKALGTFGYQVTVAGNAEFARYVPRTWAHVTRAARALGWDGLLEVMPRFGDPVA